jgi:hypothetical protein
LEFSGLPEFSSKGTGNRQSPLVTVAKIQTTARAEYPSDQLHAHIYDVSLARSRKCCGRLDLQRNPRQLLSLLANGVARP